MSTLEDDLARVRNKMKPLHQAKKDMQAIGTLNTTQIGKMEAIRRNLNALRKTEKQILAKLKENRCRLK